MSPSLLDFLKHIEHECEFILKLSKDKTLQDIINDELLSKGIVRSLEIIGEATKKLPPDFRSAHPLVRWEDMAGMRDILIHNYFGIDYEVVWNTITKDIPELREQLKSVIAAESP
ncbi:MAG: DUF86 domain-containing protein [Bacteroidota bacterium]